MWQTYLRPTSLEETLELLSQFAGQARLVAGGTDVLVELQRGVKPTTTLIDITALRDLKSIRIEGDYLSLGALTTHNDIVASADCVRYALPLAQACWEVGAPQIRTRATIAGNLVTASPANDTISPLMALGAEVVLVSTTGKRVVSLHDFYPGFRRTALRPDELLYAIRIPSHETRAARSLSQTRAASSTSYFSAQYRICAHLLWRICECRIHYSRLSCTNHCACFYC